MNAQSVTATFTAGSSDLAWVDTQALAGTLDTATFSTTLSDGDYLWNCLVRTDEGGTIWETWATSDAQFAFDGPDPLVAHTGPDRAVSDTDGDGSQDVTLDASASTGLIQSYEWDINGDGEVDATGQTPTITLAVSDQAYTIALTVTDDAATSDTDTVLITVNANEAPVADAGPDQTVSSTDTITLDGSGSSDDGSIVSYVWTEGAAILGSDQILDLTGSLPIGSHTVTLTVTDEAMVEDTDTVVINVELAPLYLDDFESGGFSEGGWGVSAQASVDASAAYEGTYGALLKKTSSMVTRIDKDGATGVTVSYYAKTAGLTGPDEKLTVEWSEDGEIWTVLSPSTTSSYQSFSNDIIFESTSTSFRIRFRTNGNAGNDQVMIDYVQVKPSDGGSDNAPPTADFSYTASNLNLTFIDESIDSDGTISRWLWDFDDGSSSTAQNPSHTYASDGFYTVTLTVTDDDDKIGTTSQDVTVSSGTTNSPPSADFSYIASDLNVTFADESIDSDGTISSWLWDFGDGSSSTAQNPSHTYASDGFYAVNLTVTDDAGEIGTAVKSITVTTASASTVTVSHIDMKKKIAGKNYFAQAVVTVSDQDGAFVADAVVYGEWYFNGVLLASAVSNGTAGDGKVTLDAPKQQTAGTFLFLVTNVVFSDYAYKPTMTEASVTVP